MILPCEKCGGQCCTFPVFTGQELLVVRLARGIPADAVVTPIKHVASYDLDVRAEDEAFMIHRANGDCPYLIDGKCSIYTMRPKVCRDYGTIRDLPCAFLYPDKAAQKHNERLQRMKS